MLIRSYDQGNAGHNPRLNFAGVGVCQECGRRAVLYPTLGFSGRHGSRRQRWVCGSCFALRYPHYLNATADRAPIGARAGDGRSLAARTGAPYKVVG